MFGDFGANLSNMFGGRASQYEIGGASATAAHENVRPRPGHGRQRGRREGRLLHRRHQQRHAAAIATGTAAPRPAPGALQRNTIRTRQQASVTPCPAPSGGFVIFSATSVTKSSYHNRQKWRTKNEPRLLCLVVIGR